MSFNGMTPYLLQPGDAVPFRGSQEEQQENLLTHEFEEVPHPMLHSVFPNPGSVPATTERCSVCLMYAPSEAVKYPCGKVVRIGPSEERWVNPQPKGWISLNRVTHNLLP